MIFVALLLVPLILSLTYTAGYLLRTASRVDWPGNVRIFGYRTEWEARAFVPAARVEGLITGHAAHTVGPSGKVR
jgi:hypothetical protein